MALSTRSLRFLVVSALLLALQSWLVSAQFDFFGQMFGQQGHPGHQQQQRPSGASYYAAQSDQVQCPEYLCPDTLVCVASPSECPCPDVQDVKCVIPDAQDSLAATVRCVRGRNECRDVERLMKAYAK